MTFLEDLGAVGGQVGRDLGAVDWDGTPLGDPEEWSASLRTAVRILLTSRFAMWMSWGPEMTFLCNDAYRRDTLGDKYPWALGRPASEVWAEIWDDISPRIDHVLTTGEATWDEGLMLLLQRSGYLEETYHTFSYSPLADDDGAVCGLLCVVSEDTAQVIATRRMTTLQSLGQRPAGLDELQAIGAACQRLGGDPRSLPFTLVYVFDHADGSAHLRGTSGITPGHPAAPPVVHADEDDAVWPSAAVLDGGTVLVDDLPARFAELPTGAWRDAPNQALVVPLLHPVEQAPYGFLVAAVNPYRRVDGAFEAFVTLVATQLSSIIADARTFEFERQRAETLTQLDQAKTDFFTNVSHEFRTPLTLLLGPAEEALVDPGAPLPDGQRERVEIIHRNGLRLLKLVNSLLDFSSLDGPGSARFEPVDLARYTRELAGMFESAAERVGVKLEVDCPELLQEVYVDQEQWAKIVLNLLSNALKFTFEGMITVRLRDEDDEVVLSVEDTGSGIPEADLPRLFERFHRVRGARGRSNEGSGIGLALVAELTAIHGGTVDVTSREGEGTTFTVRVPTGRAHLPAEQVGDEPVAVEPARYASGFVSEVLQWVRAGEVGDQPAVDAEAATDESVDKPAPLVLVADDNDDMREYVAQLLRPLYRVVTAVDGLDALNRAAEERPDLVLTDVMMPRLDGFGLLRRLHQDPDLTTVPVIMLSARAGEEGVVGGLEAGADDYLVKPFSGRELLARVAVNLELDRVRRVRRSLERSQELLGQAQRLAKVGSWELDLEADRLWGTDEFHRIVGVDAEELERRGFRAVLRAVVHPEDSDAARRAVEGVEDGQVAEAVVRIRRPGSDSADERRVLHTWIQVDPDGDGRRLLRGSVQDVTEQRRMERAMVAAAAREEAAAREHAIAHFLQRSLLPERTYDLEQLEVATYYRAGVEGTEVGGDWYDVIELGPGRVALVVGDVMGRGVIAASVMGQMRSAVRTLARLGMPPGEVIEQLDAFVSELGDYQMVTCVYAVADSTARTLSYANAGHVPPLLLLPDGGTVWLHANTPPLGVGVGSADTLEVELVPETRVVMYTDGLVEERGGDLADGMAALEEQARLVRSVPVVDLPARLVDALRPAGPDDDVALLVTRVNEEPVLGSLDHRVGHGEDVIGRARRLVTERLQTWELPQRVVEEVAMTSNELVTNAVVHGTAPVDVRVVRTARNVVVEVTDTSPDRPRQKSPAADEEHGRGLRVVEGVATRWGVRPARDHKTVWCSHRLPTLTPDGD